MKGTCSFWLLLSIGLNIPLVAQAADDTPDYEKIAPGQTFVLAAPVGTTNDMLGQGFAKDFSESDANGNRHRAFAPKFKRVTENQYFSQFEQLDNEFELNAHAKFMASSMNVNFSQQKRYIVLRVYQLKEVVVLEQGKLIEPVPLVAQKIFYGWALNVIFEGDASTFTSEAAVELTTAGADFDTAIKRYNLKKYVHLVGMEAKNKGHVPIVVDADKIEENFKISDKPSPIFVEYKVMDEIFSHKLSWQRNGFKPGRYRLTAISVKLTSTKANGRPWDALGDEPDPLASVYVDGVLVDTCFTRNQQQGNCQSQKIVELNEKSSMKIHVVDKDLSADDPVGDASVENIMTTGRPYSEIDLTTDGQLERATVTFVPLNDAPPAVAAPAEP